MTYSTYSGSFRRMLARISWGFSDVRRHPSDIPWPGVLQSIECSCRTFQEIQQLISPEEVAAWQLLEREGQVWALLKMLEGRS